MYSFFVCSDITNGHTRKLNLSDTTPIFPSSRPRSQTSKSMGKIQVNFYRVLYRKTLLSRTWLDQDKNIQISECMRYWGESNQRTVDGTSNSFLHLPAVQDILYLELFCPVFFSSFHTDKICPDTTVLSIYIVKSKICLGMDLPTDYGCEMGKN